MAQPQEVIRVQFEEDKPARKLKPKHRHIRAAVVDSGKSIGDLLGDWAGGWPYLLRALLKEGDPSVTIDKASDLIDSYFALHTGNPKAMEELGNALGQSLALYVHVEITPRAEEADEDGVRPPRAGQGQPAPTDA